MNRDRKWSEWWLASMIAYAMGMLDVDDEVVALAKSGSLGTA